MLRVRCLRGGSRGAEAAHLIGAMVGIMVVSFLSECVSKEATWGRKHKSTKNKEYTLSAGRLLSLEINSFLFFDLI